MDGLGQSILEEGIEQGTVQGIGQGIEQGIEIFILDNLEEQIPRERIIEKLQRRYELTREAAEKYYERFKAG